MFLIEHNVIVDYVVLSLMLVVCADVVAMYTVQNCRPEAAAAQFSIAAHADSIEDARKQYSTSLSPGDFFQPTLICSQDIE